MPVRRPHTPHLPSAWITPSPGCDAAADMLPSTNHQETRNSAAESHMLIVDADAQHLAHVSRMAEKLGFQTTMAKDVVDALWFITKKAYAVVVASNDLPCIDGYQLAVKIKRKHRQTVVIIMTRFPMGAIDGRSEVAGVVDGWLSMPFDLSSMRAQLDRVARLRWHCRRARCNR